MDGPYRRPATPPARSEDPGSSRSARLRSRFVTVAIAVATIAVASLAFGAEPTLSGCSVAPYSLRAFTGGAK
jgi:hypothetical protein